MCNDYRLKVDIATIADDFADMKVKIRFSEGVPNIPPRDDIKITDIGPIVRSVPGDAGVGDLVQRRWSWPGSHGKPVYNFRSDGREFTSGRCLIIADGFYEFTKPTEPGKKLKDKWLFTKVGDPWFCIAGLWRTDPKVGETFTMLTMSPGLDIEPYHDRQIAVLERSAWASWLDPSVPAQTVLKAVPAGTFHIEQVG